MKRVLRTIIFYQFLFVILVSGASGASEVGKVLSTSKKVYLLRAAQKLDAKPQMALLLKDAVATDEKSRVKLSFQDDSILNLGELSKVEIEQYLYSPEKNRAKSVFKLIDGSLKVVVGRSDLEVHTSTALAAARGTKFVIWSEGKDEALRSCTMVMEGKVLFRNIKEEVPKEVIITKDSMSCLLAGMPPDDARPIDSETLKRFSQSMAVLGAATDITRDVPIFREPIVIQRTQGATQVMQAPPVAQQSVSGLSGSLSQPSAPTPVPTPTPIPAPAPIPSPAIVPAPAPPAPIAPPPPVPVPEDPPPPPPPPPPPEERR
ncbi:MAG: FecR domain-containing protein [Nitrospirae bacterium]|nr:FecR domain-containing protein [Nitrospirota bacterium]